MMKREWELLFSKFDLRAALESELTKVGQKVLSIDPTRYKRESDDLLAASVASELVVSPLEVLETSVTVAAADAQVDVRYDRNRAIFDHSRPVYVNGLEVTYHLPFVGDKDLWRARPNQYTLSPPRAVIGDRELTFPYDQADRDIVATKGEFHRDLATLKEWLAWVNQQVHQHNASLEQLVKGRVQQRRNELEKTAVDLAALGYPVRDNKSVPRSGVQAAIEPPAKRREAARARTRRRYDVALSFAGEDREYVRRVADSLVGVEVTVFFDEFEQVNLWGADLAEHLGKVYSEDAHFVVLFASRSYAEKAWPNHEKQFALGRHLRGEKGRILPVRIDDTEIPGLPPTIGYLDARVLTAEKLASLVRAKVDSDGGDA